MLTKRAQILFDDSLWKQVQKIARKNKVSAATIIRDAVKNKLEEEKLQKKSGQAVREIRRIRKKIKGIDYKEYVNYGRKY